VFLYDIAKTVYDAARPLNLTLGTGVIAACWLFRKELFGSFRR